MTASVRSATFRALVCNAGLLKRGTRARGAWLWGCVLGQREYGTLGLRGGSRDRLTLGQGLQRGVQQMRTQVLRKIAQGGKGTGTREASSCKPNIHNAGLSAEQGTIV